LAENLPVFLTNANKWKKELGNNSNSNKLDLFKKNQN
jgi:hypothetical protein